MLARHLSELGHDGTTNLLVRRRQGVVRVEGSHCGGVEEGLKMDFGGEEWFTRD
jgi:hypothetical protein